MIAPNQFYPNNPAKIPEDLSPHPWLVRARGETVGMNATRPKALPPVVQNIPPELKELDRWAAWRWELRDGKWTKPPLCPSTGRYARNNDPDTWESFKAALRRMHRDHLPGIGFVFHAADPHAGVDLDGCRNPKTGEVAAWARRIVEELDSYTEISPSETGLKIFLCGKLPPGRRRKGNVEMYEAGRFFTVTGHRLAGVPAVVSERARELAALHRRVFGDDSFERRGADRVARPSGPAGGETLPNDKLLRRAATAANGEKFAALWAGDTSGYASGDNEGRSEADLALCSLLAFWCGPDEDRIDGLFRQSGLMRPKWDERRYGDGRTYGQGTIQHALAGRVEFWNVVHQPSRSKARRIRGRAARV